MESGNPENCADVIFDKSEDDDVTDAASSSFSSSAADTLMKCFVCYEVRASCFSHLVYYTRRKDGKREPLLLVAAAPAVFGSGEPRHMSM